MSPRSRRRMPRRAVGSVNFLWMARGTFDFKHGGALKRSFHDPFTPCFGSVAFGGLGLRHFFYPLDKCIEMLYHIRKRRNASETVPSNFGPEAFLFKARCLTSAVSSCVLLRVRCDSFGSGYLIWQLSLSRVTKATGDRAVSIGADQKSVRVRYESGLFPKN